jgi:uncharacterized protein with beta-barrel porin domain
MIKMAKTLTNTIAVNALKLKKFLTSIKFLGLGSVLTVLFASTSATAVDLTGNDIYADGVNNATGSITDPSADMAIDLKGHVLTAGTVASASVNMGAVTDTGTGGDLIITNVNNGNTLSWTIGSLQATGNLDVDMIDVEAAATVTITGNATVGGVLALETAEEGAIVDMNVTVGGNLINIGALTMIADTTSNVILTVSGNHTAGATTVLTDKTMFSILKYAGTGAQIVTGAVNGGGANQGKISVTNTGGTVTFASVIGAIDLKAIDTAASSTVAFSAAVDVQTLTQLGAATYTGAAAATTRATLSGDATFTTTLIAPEVDITAGTTTFNGKVTASTDVNVAGANTVVNFNTAASDLGELVVAAGQVNINIKAMDIGDLDLNSGEIVLSKTAFASGDTVFKTSGQADALTAGSKIYMPASLKTNETLLLFDDGGTNALTAAKVDVVVPDTALIDYTFVKNNTNDITVTVTAKETSVTAKELGVTNNKARALAQALTAAIVDGANADSDLEDNFFDSMHGRGSFDSVEDTKLAEQVAPQTDAISGGVRATQAMTGTVQGIVSNRMASLRSGDAYVTGVAAGSGMSVNSAFIQAFGSKVEQDDTQGDAGTTEYGYDVDTTGMAIGFDAMTDSGNVVGFSVSYSESEVDGNGQGNATNDIESYTASVYADKVTNFGYLEGSLTLGMNSNSTTRVLTAAGQNNTYKGSYDSEQVSLKIGAGKPIEVGSSSYVTPFASATGTVINTDEYTETSTKAADNLRLKIANDDVNSVVGSIGIKAHSVTDSGTPMISLAINNEFGDNTTNSTNTYTGGGTAFKTESEVEELSATLGLGYTFGNETVSLNLGAEVEANQNDYLSKYGTVKLIAKF